MRLGLDQYTIADRGLSPTEVLDFALALGLDGVQYLDPASISPGLAAGPLEALESKAARLGLYLEVGLPSPNPARRSRTEGRPVSANEHARDLIPHVEAAARLGVRHARIYLGDRHDRFRADPPWKEQLDACGDVLKRLKPALRSCSLKIAIETHADVTVSELLRLVERLGTDSAGVTLDTGNLLMRLEDPLAAARALAPLVLATHVKDAVLALSPRGLVWQARPVGSGVVPIREIVGLLARANPALNLSIELHPRTYDLPTLDPTWLAHFPDLTSEGLATIEAYADRCEALYRDKEGGRPRPEVVEAIPWAERALPWIESSRDFLRAVVAEIESSQSASSG